MPPIKLIIDCSEDSHTVSDQLLTIVNACCNEFDLPFINHTMSSRPSHRKSESTEKRTRFSVKPALIGERTENEVLNFFKTVKDKILKVKKEWDVELKAPTP